MQDAQSSCRENAHENRRNREGNKEDNDKWPDWLAQLVIKIRVVPQNEVADRCSRTANCQFTKQIENTTNPSRDCKGR